MQLIVVLPVVFHLSWMPQQSLQLSLEWDPPAERKGRPIELQILKLITIRLNKWSKQDLRINSHNNCKHILQIHWNSQPPSSLEHLHSNPVTKMRYDIKALIYQISNDLNGVQHSEQIWVANDLINGSLLKSFQCTERRMLQ